MSAARDPIVSLSELTAEYYKLRAEAERTLAINSGDPSEKGRRLAKAAEFEALRLDILPSNADAAPLAPSDPLHPDNLAFNTVRAA